MSTIPQFAKVPPRYWLDSSAEWQDVHLTKEAKQIWIACYSASLVRQIHEHVTLSEPSFDGSVLERCREEAAAVADLALGITKRST